MTPNDILFQMLPLAQRGYCCSQILFLLALEAQDRKNPELVRAMAGLCNGLGHSGELCGVLTGGACLIAFYAGKGSEDEEAGHERLNLIISELTEWFREHIGAEYGGMTCRDILKDAPDQKPDMSRCANILAETYMQIMTILVENEIETVG